eukprot:jgi/Mesvir1/28216/Mv04767-RA.3
MHTHMQTLSLSHMYTHAKPHAQGGDSVEDDEFGYAFADKPREGPEAAKPKFHAEPLPAHLVSTVGKQPLASFTEEEEEGADESEEPPGHPTFQAVLRTNMALAGAEARSGNGAVEQGKSPSSSLRGGTRGSPYADLHDSVADASLAVWATGGAAATAPHEALDRSGGDPSASPSSSPTPSRSDASPSGGQFNVTFSKWSAKPGAGDSGDTTPPEEKAPLQFVLPDSALSDGTSKTLSVSVSPRASNKGGASTPEVESPTGANTRYSVSGWGRGVVLDSPGDVNSRVSVSSLAGWGRGGALDSPGDVNSRVSVSSLAGWGRGAALDSPGADANSRVSVSSLAGWGRGAGAATPDSPSGNHGSWQGPSVGNTSPHEPPPRSSGYRFSLPSMQRWAEGAGVVGQTVPEGEDDAVGVSDEGNKEGNLSEVSLEDLDYISVNSLTSPEKSPRPLLAASSGKAGQSPRPGGSSDTPYEGDNDSTVGTDSITFPTGAAVHGSLGAWLSPANKGGSGTGASAPLLPVASRSAVAVSPVAESHVQELEAQWDAVTAQHAVHAVEPVKPGPPRNQAAALKQGVLSYQEVEAFFCKADIRPYLKKIQEEPVQGFVSKCLCSMFGPPALKERMLEKRKHIFAAAQMPLDNAEPFHLRLLQNIFARLVGNVAAGQVARFGSHWSQVGFQGSDPATDLRGCGMLGLIQMMFLITHNASNAQIIFQLSRSKEQEFPFAPVAINITKWALEVLRSGKLNRDANQLGDVFLATNLFYAGSFYEFHQRWKTGHFTIRESGTVIREVELFVKEFPRKMINKASTVLGAN